MFPVNGFCRKGHRLTEENVYVAPNGDRACRTCKKDRKDDWRKTPEGKELRRKHRIKCHYGLDDKDIESMLKEQNNLCKLCHKPFTERISGRKGNSTAWVVDHDHLTNANRGLIHQNCNLAIGFLEDSPEMCTLAAVYLEKCNAVQVKGTTEIYVRT